MITSSYISYNPFSDRVIDAVRDLVASASASVSRDHVVTISFKGDTVPRVVPLSCLTSSFRAGFIFPKARLPEEVYPLYHTATTLLECLDGRPSSWLSADTFSGIFNWRKRLFKAYPNLRVFRLVHPDAAAARDAYATYASIWMFHLLHDRGIDVAFFETQYESADDGGLPNAVSLDIGVFCGPDIIFSVEKERDVARFFATVTPCHVTVVQNPLVDKDPVCQSLVP